MARAMTFSDTQRVTAVSFLTYFLLSSMLAPIGIISAPMAEHFGQSITEATRQFSWLTGGNLIGAILALFVFDWFRLKNLIISIYTVIAGVLASLIIVDDLVLSSLVLGVVGLGSGIGLAGGALTISRVYQRDQRASMLIITDGCFSVAGFTTGWLATYLVASQFQWSAIYLCVGILAVVIVLLTTLSEFPATALEEADDSGVEPSPWPLSVWLCVACLFLYTLGQYSMLFWLPNYAETILGAKPTQAGGLVGQFWLGMFFAQIFVAWWVYRIGLRNLVTIGAISTLIFSIPLWNLSSPELLSVAVLLWGFGNFSLLKGVLSLATQLVSAPSARLISLMLLGATMGTALSPFVTSKIVELTDNHTILAFSSCCYAALALLILVIRYRTAPGSKRH